MRNALTILLILALAAGGYYWYQDRDNRYATQVLNCVYDGSFDPIKETLHPEAQKSLSDPTVKAHFAKGGAQMKQVYGEVKKMKFESEEPLDAAFAKVFGEGCVQKKFTATSDKGTFDWILFVDKEDKLLSFRPGSLTPLDKSK